MEVAGEGGHGVAGEVRQEAERGDRAGHARFGAESHNANHGQTAIVHLKSAAREAGPLHDIAIANTVWCIAYTRGVEWGPYIAQSPCNSIVTVWAMQAGRK